MGYEEWADFFERLFEKEVPEIYQGIIEIKAIAREAGERTKMLFINSPHNPTGAVLSKEELGQIADFAKANNLLVVSDEAYDRLLYDGLEHRSIASEPGRGTRVTIGLDSLRMRAE